MRREERSHTAERTVARSPLERVRGLYHRYPPRSRLLAMFAVVTVGCLLAYLFGFSVALALAVTLALLGLVTALMHSSQAVATAVVCIVWLAVAYPLFQIPLAGSSVVLVLTVLPLLVALAAGRIRMFPVWHTTLLALVVGLIVGLAVALASMVTDAVPPAAGVKIGRAHV